MKLLHRLEQGGLRLGRSPIDLVGQNDLREDRPFDKVQPALAVLFVEDFSACDVRGHQVGCELDSFELELENVGERSDEQRLGQTGNARDQTVTARKERDQHLLDDFILPDDDLSQLGEDARSAVRDFLDAYSGFGSHQCVSE